MILSNITTNLFNESVLMITGLPSGKPYQQVIQDANNIEFIEQLKIKVIRQSFTSLIAQMANARKAAFDHSDSYTLSREKMDALDYLQNNASNLDNIKELNLFIEKVRAVFVPKLEIIKPANTSKFYKNYQIQLEVINDFINNNSK